MKAAVARLPYVVVGVGRVERSRRGSKGSADLVEMLFASIHATLGSIRDITKHRDDIETMLCGCGGKKKSMDELSLYGAPRPRQHHHHPRMQQLDRDVYEEDGVLRSDQEYPGMCMSAQCHSNPGFDSGIDSGTLGGSLSSPDSSSTQRMLLDITALKAPSLPMLEFAEKSEDMEGISVHGNKMFQQYKGQLKMCVYMNSGLITVHVIQGRHFTSKYSSYCNSYVRLSLSPDPLRRTRCKTALIKENNNPVIDEKVSFEMLPDDVHKRLLVSVWNRDPDQNSSELLGCMSFGIQNILNGKNVINGWYFLLSEKVGKKKHLQSQNKRKGGSQPSYTHSSTDLATSDSNLVTMPSYSSSSSSNMHSPAFTRSNSNMATNSDSCFSLATTPMNDSSHTSDSAVSSATELSPTCGRIAKIHVRRGQSGFGISLTGGSPTQVFMVEPGSPADLAGLKSGDVILRISGQDVSRATANTVSRIFRFSEKDVTLTVHHCSGDRCFVDLASSPLPSPTSRNSTSNTSGNSSAMSYS